MNKKIVLHQIVDIFKTPSFIPSPSCLNSRFSSIPLQWQAFSVRPCQTQQMFVSLFTICFFFLLKSVIVASASSTYFLPSAPLLSLHSCRILLMLHMFPANMGYCYQRSLITLICCFLTKIFKMWQFNKVDLMYWRI